MPDSLDLGALFDAHGRYVVRVLTRMTGRADLAEDLAQEVFLVAWNRRDEIEDMTGIRTWLYRVAFNIVRHRRRSEGRYGAALDRFKRAVTPVRLSPEDEVSSSQTAEAVRRVIQRLSPKQREVFVLFELEELDGAEIASILDIPVNTVWSRLRLARAAFRRHWEAP